MSIVPNPDAFVRERFIEAGSADIEIAGVLLRHRGCVIGHADVTFEVEWDRWGEWHVGAIEFASTEHGINDGDALRLYAGRLTPEDRRLWDAVLAEADARLTAAVEAEMEG